MLAALCPRDMAVGLIKAVEEARNRTWTDGDVTANHHIAFPEFAWHNADAFAGT